MLKTSGWLTSLSVSPIRLKTVKKEDCLERVFSRMTIAEPTMFIVGSVFYSTVTDLAKLRRWSTSQPPGPGNVMSITLQGKNAQERLQHIDGRRCYW